jgi:type IV secretory pathway VirB4 component
LSGRAENISKLDHIRTQVGDRRDEPSAWLPLYLEESHESSIHAA